MTFNDIYHFLRLHNIERFILDSKNIRLIYTLIWFYDVRNTNIPIYQVNDPVPSNTKGFSLLMKTSRIMIIKTFISIVLKKKSQHGRNLGHLNI